MSLSIGIVGLPNVGKSTLFNALTKAQNAEVASYPFCTIEPNRAVVPVPDERVESLQRQTGVPEAIHATITFVDIAGLVEGASHGEGLGNQFLSNIRDVDLIVHLVRCFEDPNVPHTTEQIDPLRDIEVINTELMLADLEQLDRKIERLESQVKGDRRKYLPNLQAAEALRENLDGGVMLSASPYVTHGAFPILNLELRFLTAKPVIYAINVGEAQLGEESQCEARIRSLAASQGLDIVKICAQLEEAVIDFDEKDRAELLKLAGAAESGLEQIVRLSYKRLGLISFFSMNENEVRAWTVERGKTAPAAAGKIHSDLERGFIRAEVIHYDDFMRYGSMGAARAAGAMRIEGKDYIVQDGDILYIRFKV
jgi:GTP-binding protein YchF